MHSSSRGLCLGFVAIFACVASGANGQWPTAGGGPDSLPNVEVRQASVSIFVSLHLCISLCVQVTLAPPSNPFPQVI